MGRKKHLVTTLCVSALAAVVAFATVARADVTLTVQQNAGPVQTTTVIGSPLGAGTSASNSFVTGSYTINVLNGLEQQSASLTELLSSTILITKIGTNADVLHLTITGTGFTAPTAPPPVNVLSTVSDTATYGGSRPTNTLAFQSTVGGTALGFQATNITATSSDSNNKNTILNVLASPFSIMQSLDIFLSTDGDKLSFGGNTILTQVPTPASAFLGLIGMAPLALRRRKIA
jgi:hypothetical protein